MMYTAAVMTSCVRLALCALIFSVLAVCVCVTHGLVIINL
jgi:hypothetical protein